MEAKSHSIACVLLVSAVLVTCHDVQHIPTVTIGAPNNSTCPTGDVMDGIRADISNKISDVLASKAACGGEGWRRVVFLNMSDPSQTCPSQWRLYEQSSLRLCGRQTYAPRSCDSVKFDTGGSAYSKVCGRITGYQYGSPDGLIRYTIPTSAIDEAYLDGISLTYGRPRKHIWSFFATYNTWVCCREAHLNETRVLGFIGNNSFCDTGNVDNERWQDTLFTSHPLWEGIAGCAYSATCCHTSSGPWFQTTLSAPTVSDIEVRICSDQHTGNEDTPLQLVEIYVK